MHPIETSRQKGEEFKPIIKNQLVDKWFKRNRLYFISNELRPHCRQNKHRLLPRELFMRVAKDTSNILYIETVKQGCEI
jgi:hypothetical protein